MTTMNSIKTYEVSCLECDAKRTVKLDENPFGTKIDWLEDGKPHQIVSFRQRLDNNYGWQCLCGNNDLLTDQEQDTFDNPVTPKAQEIDEIVKNLSIQEPRFVLTER